MSDLSQFPTNFPNVIGKTHLRWPVLLGEKVLHFYDYYRNLMSVRYPAKQKAETREKILSTAARSFREHGSEMNGIGQS